MIDAADIADLPEVLNIRGHVGHRRGGQHCRPNPKKKLLASLIAKQAQGWSPSFATDPVEQALRSVIETKQKHARRSTKKPMGTKGGHVIDLMAVLKKSLQGRLPQRR